MRNYDVKCFCFDSEIRNAKEYRVSATYKITSKFIVVQHVSLHEIDIQLH